MTGHLTLRCRAERHELCPDRADTHCHCHCHWQLFDDTPEDDRDD